MGSICDVAEEVVDYLTAKGEKVGLVLVRLYRPWVSSALLKVLPKTVKKIAVLDRTKEPGSLGEPLYLDVATTLREAGMNDVVLTGGRYGLGSKDTPPSSVFAIYTELEKDAPKPRFTIGITDDVTNLSLPEVKPAPITSAPGTKECKFWGLGGDGTVGANKNSTKIIGDHTDKYIQAYFQYDSKKTGGVTISHLRFGDKPIRSPYSVSYTHLPLLDLLDLVRGTETIEEVHEGNATLDSGQVSNRGQVHDLLRVALGQHGKAGLTDGHNIAVVTEDVQGLGSNGTGGNVEDAGQLLSGDLVHVGDHQKKTLRSGECGCQCACRKGTVNCACCAALGLHFRNRCV